MTFNHFNNEDCFHENLMKTLRTRCCILIKLDKTINITDWYPLYLFFIIKKNTQYFLVFWGLPACWTECPSAPLCISGQHLAQWPLRQDSLNFQQLLLLLCVCRCTCACVRMHVCARVCLLSLIYVCPCVMHVRIRLVKHPTWDLTSAHIPLCLQAWASQPPETADETEY